MRPRSAASPSRRSSTPPTPAVSTRPSAPGTAAVVSPVGALCWNGEKLIINNGEIGPIAQKLYDTLTGIQYGELKDDFGWVVKLN